MKKRKVQGLLGEYISCLLGHIYEIEAEKELPEDKKRLYMPPEHERRIII